jgi:hypothetical protein
MLPTDAPYANWRFIDAYIDTQIIMISPNKIALHWVELGHINYFEKVDIDQFVTLE